VGKSQDSMLIVMAHQLGPPWNAPNFPPPWSVAGKKMGQMLGQPVKSQTEPGQIHGTWMSIWGLQKKLSRDFHKF
jgi:hypothetical protein